MIKMTGSNKKLNYSEQIGIKVSKELKNWIKEDYSNRIRSILEWLQESYPSIENFMEKMK